MLYLVFVKKYVNKFIFIIDIYRYHAALLILNDVFIN